MRAHPLDELVGPERLGHVVIGAETDRTPYICDVARMTDGVMLAPATAE